MRKNSPTLVLNGTSLNRLPYWKHTQVFDHQQKLVLGWAEAVISNSNDWYEIKEKLKEHFTEREIVELTANITLMNT
ncbi:hypothetical protein [Chryseobacterium sp.]|uniref:hypothetical protein n=1 Tax=Chryseobacterium sp. TaxID=1871047 RepID=UPI002623ECD3|nr:hypothetical protein [Chryseobacterium sp.]